MKKKNVITLVMAVLYCLSTNSQVVPPQIPPPSPPGLPINESILFLIIAGLFYGVRKLKD